MQCVYAIILLKSNESKWKTNEQNNNACVDKLRTTSESYRNNMRRSKDYLQICVSSKEGNGQGKKRD